MILEGCPWVFGEEPEPEIGSPDWTILIT